MEIKDSGFVIDIKNYLGDKKIIKILSKNQGIWKGMTFYKGCISSFDFVNFTWKSKTLDNLGVIQLEVKRNYFVDFLHDEKLLLCIKSISLLLNNLPERINLKNLFLILDDMLNSNGKIFLANYIFFIVFYFAELGYPFDFSRCAVSGVCDNLDYVSPRTGRAVSHDHAGQYRDRLLKLPEFFKRKTENYDEFAPKDFAEVLEFFDFFYNKYIDQNDMILSFNKRIQKLVIT